MSWLFRDYRLSLPLTEECTPFDETTLVYKVGGKMYAHADMENFGRVAVKCDPDEAVSLREEYPDVTPAWHSSKKHWNDIRTTGDLPDAFIRTQIRNSYLLVLRQNVTPKSLREEILAMSGNTACPNSRCAGSCPALRLSDQILDKL